MQTAVVIVNCKGTRPAVHIELCPGAMLYGPNSAGESIGPAQLPDWTARARAHAQQHPRREL